MKNHNQYIGPEKTPQTIGQKHKARHGHHCALADAFELFLFYTSPIRTRTEWVSENCEIWAKNWAVLSRKGIADLFFCTFAYLSSLAYLIHLTQYLFHAYCMRIVYHAQNMRKNLTITYTHQKKEPRSTNCSQWRRNVHPHRTIGLNHFHFERLKNTTKIFMYNPVVK